MNVQTYIAKIRADAAQHRAAWPAEPRHAGPARPVMFAGAHVADRSNARCEGEDPWAGCADQPCCRCNASCYAGRHTA